VNRAKFREEVERAKRRAIKEVLSVNDLHTVPEEREAMRAIVLSAMECFSRRVQELANERVSAIFDDLQQ
jgi:hypothetical protein